MLNTEKPKPKTSSSKYYTASCSVYVSHFNGQIRLEIEPVDKGGLEILVVPKALSLGARVIRQKIPNENHDSSSLWQRYGTNTMVEEDCSRPQFRTVQQCSCSINALIILERVTIITGFVSVFVKLNGATALISPSLVDHDAKTSVHLSFCSTC